MPQAAIGLVVLTALVIGAVSMARGANHASSGVPRPEIIRWADEGVSDVVTLDPANGPDFNTRLVEQLIYGGLVRFGPGFTILPDTARSWRVSKDLRTYTFYIRPNVRFADGRRLTASDIVYSFNRTLQPQYATTSGPYFLSAIQGAPDVTAGRVKMARGIQALDPHRLRVRLSAPDGSFLAKLATPAGYIVSPKAVAANPRNWSLTAFGTGPFQVKRWVRGTEILLVPNKEYWGGRVHVTGIDMPFIPEPVEAYKRYQAGALDTVGSVRFPTAELFDAEGQKDFRASTRLETVFLTLNERRPPFNNIKVREALERAIDKNVIVRDVFMNFAEPAAGMVPPGLLGYNRTIAGTGHSLAQARRLLKEAGHPHGRGLPPITYIVDQDTQAIALATELREQWSQLGIRIRLIQLGHGAYDSALQNLQYQIGVIDWTADYPDPENFLSQQLHSNVPNNNSGWSNPAFDRMVDRADRMSLRDPNRGRLYQQADALAMREAANIPLVHPRVGILLRQRIHGLPFEAGQLIPRSWTQVTVASGASQ